MPTGYRIKKDLMPDNAPIKLCNNAFTEAVLAEDFVDLADILIDQRSYDYYVKLNRYKKSNIANYFAVNYKYSSTSNPVIVPWEHTLAIPYKGRNSGGIPDYSEFVLKGARPTFTPLINFCGANESTQSHDIETFSYNIDKTITVFRNAYGFQFGYTDISNNNQLISKYAYPSGSTIIPTCLIVQLQAEGGKGGTCNQSTGGCGLWRRGGAGGNAYNTAPVLGNSGNAFIAFYTDDEFGKAVPTIATCTITLNSGTSVAPNNTRIAYLQEEGNINNYANIFPNTVAPSYPTGCDKNNTLLYLNSGSGGRFGKKMSEIALGTGYLTYNDARSNPHWSYTITFTSI